MFSTELLYKLMIAVCSLRVVLRLEMYNTDGNNCFHLAEFTGFLAAKFHVSFVFFAFAMSFFGPGFAEFIVILTIFVFTHSTRSDIIKACTYVLI